MRRILAKSSLNCLSRTLSSHSRVPKRYVPVVNVVKEPCCFGENFPSPGFGLRDCR